MLHTTGSAPRVVHTGSKDVAPIVRAGGAKSFRSPERGGLVSGEWATGL